MIPYSIAYQKNGPRTAEGGLIQYHPRDVIVSYTKASSEWGDVIISVEEREGPFHMEIHLEYADVDFLIEALTRVKQFADQKQVAAGGLNK